MVKPDLGLVGMVVGGGELCYGMWSAVGPI